MNDTMQNSKPLRTPEEVAKNPASYTGQYLVKWLEHTNRLAAAQKKNASASAVH